MSKLSRFVVAHINATGIQDKDFASTFFDDLRGRVGEDRAGKWETVQPKLSKFLKGDVEGEKFFMDDARRPSFAHALQVSAAELVGLKAVRTLVLDPRLAVEARAYLRDAADRPDARHDCVELDASELSGLRLTSGVVEERLRLCSALGAKAEANHGCLVVLHDLDDRGLFDGAKIEVTKVTEDPLGWVLSSDPNLVPLSPPPPPLLYSPATGPLVRAPELIADVRAALEHRSNYSRARPPELPFTDHQLDEIAPRLKEADRVGREVTFRMDDLGSWLAKRSGIEPLAITWCPHGFRNGRATLQELAKRCFESVTDTLTKTVVWNHNERIFAIGPLLGAVRTMLPDHEVHVPATFEHWRAAVAEWNPWRTLPSSDWGPSDSFTGLSERWRELTSGIEQETGVDIGQVVDLWRKRHEPEPLPAEPWELAFDAKEEARCREVLRAVVARPFVLRLSNARVLFRLQLACEASLLPLPRGPRDSCHVLANIGAGHLLQVRVLEYPKESRTAIGSMGSDLDGGDVHLVLGASNDILLEASPLPATKRRRAEALEVED